MYSVELADAVDDAGRYFDAAVVVAEALVDGDPTKQALIAESIALRLEAQAYLDEARAAYANGDEAQAKALLKKSLEKSTLAAQKLAEAAGE